MAQSLGQLTTETIQGGHRVAEDQMGNLQGREEGETICVENTCEGIGENMLGRAPVLYVDR